MHEGTWGRATGDRSPPRRAPRPTLVARGPSGSGNIVYILVPRVDWTHFVRSSLTAAIHACYNIYIIGRVFFARPGIGEHIYFFIIYISPSIISYIGNCCQVISFSLLDILILMAIKIYIRLYKLREIICSCGQIYLIILWFLGVYLRKWHYFYCEWQ